MSGVLLLEGARAGLKDGSWYGPDLSTHGTQEPDLLVYFIPGNPGLISYYDRFLQSLSKLLNSKTDRERSSAVVGGYSLPGFQRSHPRIIKGTLPAGLTDQILNVEELVIQGLENNGSDDDARNGRRTRVVLVAHSVGAYMTLEILRRRAKHLNRLASVDIIGAILLFPTIVEIAQSPNGTKMSVCLD
jgi:pimeloyl-ACP methyl ester carboxylesterase